MSQETPSSEATSSRPHLLRAVGPFAATAVIVGTVIGSGVFRKPALIADSVPGFTFVALVWILGGVLSFLGAVALAEVCVLFPRAGGNYVFLREGFGRMAGFLWGWVEFWMIRAGSLAALATVFTDSLHDILRMQSATQSPVLSFWQQRFVTITVIFGLALVNVRGVRWGAGLQFFITLVKVGSLLGIMVLPFVIWAYAAPPAAVDQLFEPSGKAFTWAGLGAALLGVLWAYHGWMNIAPLAGEVKEPQRNLPIAFLAGVGCVVFLYLGANLAYHLVIPMPEMAALNVVGAPSVVAVFCRDLLGPIGAMVASAAVMCSVFGALNGNLLVGPRLLYAMGEDGLAPRALSAVHPRYNTPALAILVMAGWAMLLVAAAGLIPTRKAVFDILTDFAMFGAVIFETLAVTTIFVFRRTIPEAPRPYRCWGYPWVPLAYLILPACIVVDYFVKLSLEALAGIGFIGVGVLVYLMIPTRRAVPSDS